MCGEEVRFLPITAWFQFGGTKPLVVLGVLRTTSPRCVSSKAAAILGVSKAVNAPSAIDESTESSKVSNSLDSSIVKSADLFAVSSTLTKLLERWSSLNSLFPLDAGL